MSNISRHPAGVPSGGQFAASSHDEAGVSLGVPDRLDLNLVDVVWADDHGRFDGGRTGNPGCEECGEDDAVASVDRRFLCSPHLSDVGLESVHRPRGELIEMVAGSHAGNHTGVRLHGDLDWTGQVALGGGPRVGVIFDVAASPLNPDADTSRAGDPKIVVWDDDGEVTGVGPADFSLHQIPGMSEHLRRYEEATGGPPVLEMRQFSGRSTTGLEWSVTSGHLGGYRVMDVHHDRAGDMAYLTVYDLDGNPVIVDGRRHRPVAGNVDAPDRSIAFRSGEVWVGKIADIGPAGTWVETTAGDGGRVRVLVESDPDVMFDDYEFARYSRQI